MSPLTNAKHSRRELFVLLLIVLSSAIFGYAGKNYLVERDSIREFDGLWLNSGNHTHALNTAYEYDSRGNWVCVNVKGMEYSRAVEVCQHEVGHEIFAEVCEKNMSRCLGVLE